MNVSPTPLPDKLLVIGYVWPEPRSSAASGHILQILQCFLEQGWQITFASPATEGEHKADLAELGIAEQAITLNCSSFDQFVSQLMPDVVLFDRFMMEEQFGWRVEKHCPDALRVLETSDLQSLRDARQLALKEQLAAGHGDDFTQLLTLDQAALFQRMANSDIAQREVAAIYRADLSLMISDAEIDLLTQQFKVPASLLLHCPLLLDSSVQPAPDFDQREHFISIGNFRHAPNWDAVLWLKNSLWPLIRQQLPKAQLHIYGAYTPPKATALHNAAQGFHVLNWAPDALEVMRRARVCLAPLRFGAGIKGKIADALLCGTPTVTTPIGAEGMHGELPWPGVIASSTQALADAAVALYRDPCVWQQAQDNGWELLKQRYERQLYAPQLLARIARLRTDLHQHRLDNFTGSMLRHHLLKSTQYMAQWIAAKNRTDTA